MKKTFAGGCHCGAVRFEVEGDFERFFLCHCSRCRKGSGSAHGANLFSTTATLRWLSGEDKIRRYQVPGARHEKSFCTDCGAALPSQLSGAFVKVPAGSLDSALAMRPTAHIFVASRAAWDERLEDVQRCDELPG